MIVPRRRRGRPVGRAIGFIVGLLVVAGAAALYFRSAGAPATMPPTRSSAASAALKTYTVRGQITELPEPSRPATSLMIRHEAIDNFVRMDGTLGMAAMTMSFPTAEGLTLGGLSVGDNVEFDFEVNWGGSPLYQVTRIVKLPPDTDVVFEPADRPPS